MTGKVYPLVRVFQLIRVKTPDDKEWVKSRQQWIGLDQLGNELEETFTDPEVWDKPSFKHEMMPKDRNNPNGPRERRAVEYTLKPEYTKPFTEKNVKELYSKTDPHAVSLLIQRVDVNGQTAGHPYHIPKYEDFVGRPFDDLWEYMENITAPRYKRDRGYGDNLEGSHIK